MKRIDVYAAALEDGRGVNWFSVAVEQEWWPGVYDTAETARYAAEHCDYVALAGLSERVCSIHGKNRPLSMDDIADEVPP